MAAIRRLSASASPLRATVPASGWLVTLPAQTGDEQLGAGPHEAVHGEDHAGRIQRVQPAQDVGRHERAVGLDEDLAGQHDLVEVAVADGARPARATSSHQSAWGRTDTREKRSGGSVVGSRAIGAEAHRRRLADGSDRGEPPIAGVVGADDHRRHDELGRPVPVEGQGAQGQGAATGDAEVIFDLDGPQDLESLLGRPWVAQALWQRDAQGPAPAGQAQAFPLPQQRGRRAADGHQVDAGEVLGQRRGAGDEAPGPVEQPWWLIGPHRRFRSGGRRAAG